MNIQVQPLLAYKLQPFFCRYDFTSVTAVSLVRVCVCVCEDGMKSNSCFEDYFKLFFFSFFLETVSWNLPWVWKGFLCFFSPSFSPSSPQTWL